MKTVLIVTVALAPEVAVAVGVLTHEHIAEVIRERLLHGNAGQYDVTVQVARELTEGVKEEGPKSKVQESNVPSAEAAL